jgi:hypothetical protein
MGRPGVCWDNALAGSFFATYKLELIEPATWSTRARARTATVHCLEAIYNRRRPHSAIDMLSPVDYEERYRDRRAAAQRRCLPGRGKTNPIHSMCEKRRVCPACGTIRAAAH